MLILKKHGSLIKRKKKCKLSSNPTWPPKSTSTNATKRKELWQHLSEALSASMPCCLVGDFNQILSQEDKLGSQISDSIGRCVTSLISLTITLCLT